MRNRSSLRSRLDHRHVSRLGKILIVLGLAIVAVFGTRAVRGLLGLHRSGLHPGMTDVEAIRGWMTLPHIARAFGVPAEPLYEAAGADPAADARESIARIARDQNRPPEDVRAAVQAAVTRLMGERDAGRPARGRPPPNGGPPPGDAASVSPPGAGAPTPPPGAGAPP